MKRNRSSISKASSYKDMGAYWDTQDLSELWDKTRRVKFDVLIESEAIYYAIEKGLSEKVQSIAKKQGVSSDTLVNLWIQEKVQQQRSR
jgi:dsDNA-specific endonuclease/ATPase MutS2